VLKVDGTLSLTKYNIPKNEFLKAIDFVFNSTSHLITRFKNRNSIHYKPVSSPFSPILTDIVMQNLEEQIVEDS